MAAEQSSLPETVLTVGIGAGVLISLSLFFALTSRNHSRRAEESEKWLALILDSAGEGICGLDMQGRTTFVNAAAVSLLGYSAKEIIGNSQHALIHHHYPNGEAYPSSRCKIGESLRYGKSCTEADEVFWRKDGTALPVEYTSRPIRNKHGKVSGAVIVFRDIADRKATDAERERLIAMLKRSNEELDNFAHIASHDLKEPMRAIHNHSRFLMEDYADKLDEDGVKRLGRLGYLTQRMERLISDLLYFSRLGRDELSTKSTDLNGVIIDIKRTLSDVLEERNVFVSVPRPLPKVDCDVVRVTELFRNLIENAIKYNKNAEKRIEIGYDDSDGYVFHVKDNGIGIEKEYYADIFRIFKRLHSEKEFAAGTGAGLTFVKKIVEQHKGRIWLESVKGVGTTFFFTLKEEESR